MGNVFQNDPKIDELPKVGEEPALLAPRTSCGLAAVWDPADGDAGALASFLGAAFVSFEGQVYQRHENGALSPVQWTNRKVVVLRPPAGDFRFIDAQSLTSEYAMVVGNGPAPVVEEPSEEGPNLPGVSGPNGDEAVPAQNQPQPPVNAGDPGTHPQGDPSFAKEPVSGAPSDAGGEPVAESADERRTDVVELPGGGPGREVAVEPVPTGAAAEGGAGSSEDPMTLTQHIDEEGGNVDLDNDGTVSTYEAMSIPQLTDELRGRHLTVSGSKATLVDRLVKDDEAKAADRPKG